jgi:carbamate kinase
MRIVVALGGNALLPRGKPLSATNQQTAIREAAGYLAEAVAAGHQLTITHGNGPQVGLLALQSLAGPTVSQLPLDVLDAESEGWIGYSVELALRNALPPGSELVTLLTQVRVDTGDPAFAAPSKPIGPVYEEATARRLATENGWAIAVDGVGWRRVVASPRPIAILELTAISRMRDAGVIVICAGGGGIPVHGAHGHLRGLEAVIDKDATSALLAKEIGAELLVMLTDVDGVYLHFGSAEARVISRASPDALEAHRESFAVGSMEPKVTAACAFARATGRRAAVGALSDLTGIIAGTKGTIVSTEQTGLSF